jgi:crotonobetainyl-CoA:carnitine CoA-transferase CaiB-like acyl-CoA transferase
MAANWLASGRLPHRNGTASQITCPWQAFDSADRPIMIAVGNDAQFRRLAGLLGLPELADDPRFATNHARVENAEALVPMLAEAFRRDSAGAWQARLEAIGIPSGPINGFDDVFAEPQVRHRDLLKTYDHPTAGPVRLVPNPVRFSETEAVATRPPPVFAADTDAVLRDLLGRSAEEIAALRASGAIA